MQNEEPSWLRRNWLLLVILTVLVCGLLIAGGKLLTIGLQYHKGRETYSNLANAVIASNGDISAQGQQAEGDNELNPELGEDPDEAEDKHSTKYVRPISSILHSLPDIFGDKTTETHTRARAPYDVDWEELQSQNSDVIGWIVCPDTYINYPVVQGEDNSFYLHHAVDGSYLFTGAIFADKDAQLDIDDSNFILYGHNMKDGSMFAQIDDYANQSFYDAHPVMYFLTPERDYTIQLISGHIVESKLTNFPLTWGETKGYADYLSEIQSVSVFQSNFHPSTDYQLITLVTCNYSSRYVSPRFLLQGQLVPIR